MTSRKRLLKKALKKGKYSMGELEQVSIEGRGNLPEIEELNEKIKNLETENNSLKEKNLRLYADFENFRKRISKEKADTIIYANERILKELLPVLDNFERAISTSEEHNDFNGLLEGIKMNFQGFQKTMEKFGVTEIDAIGKEFDPNFHEAMSMVETQDYEPNRVINQFQKGYIINGKLLRPAMVVVSKLPAEESSEEKETAS